jgi:hypothetical protein
VLQDGDVVDELPEGADMTVVVKIPSGMEDESFSVEDGYVRAATSHTGTFVLVEK